MLMNGQVTVAQMDYTAKADRQNMPYSFCPVTNRGSFPAQ